MSCDKITGHHLIPCERCGKEFDSRSGYILSRRSFSVPAKNATTDFLKKTSWQALCSSCLEDIELILTSLEGEVFPRPTELKENYHYYIENEFCVFTERYHILRGSCCKSGCRHCPYGFKKQK